MFFNTSNLFICLLFGGSEIIMMEKPYALVVSSQVIGLLLHNAHS